VRLIRELAFFADRDEPCLEFDGGGGGENKTASINSDDCVDAAGLDILGEQIDATGEEARVGEDGSDVFELDAGFWKIGDVANGAFDFCGSGTSLGHDLVRLMRSCINRHRRIL